MVWSCCVIMVLVVLILCLSCIGLCLVFMYFMFFVMMVCVKVVVVVVLLFVILLVCVVVLYSNWVFILVKGLCNEMECVIIMLELVIIGVMFGCLMIMLWLLGLSVILIVWVNRLILLSIILCVV